jgi:uncharacterized phage-associated protein
LTLCIFAIRRKKNKRRTFLVENSVPRGHFVLTAYDLVRHFKLKWVKFAMKFSPLSFETYAREFFPDKDRVLEAIVYIMNERQNLSQYEIVKSIFFADRIHLNQFGRPITFDSYVAMEQGPVPSLTYDLLKPGDNFRSLYKQNPPWVYSSNGRINRFRAVRQANLDILSKTDLEALKEGLSTVITLPRAELEKKLHDDPAYVEAWKRRGTKKSIDIKAVNLLDSRSEEVIENLSYATRR